MFFLKLIFRELKDWIEFLIQNVPGKLGFGIRSFYYSRRLRKPFTANRFELGIRIEYPITEYIFL